MILKLLLNLLEAYIIAGFLATNLNNRMVSGAVMYINIILFGYTIPGGI